MEGIHGLVEPAWGWEGEVFEEGGWTEEDGKKEDVAAYVAHLLSSKAAMLKEYFAIDIEDGCVCTLPELLEHYTPPFGRMPMFLLRLGVDCVWDREQECFQSVCKEIACFYQLQPGMYLNQDESVSVPSSTSPDFGGAISSVVVSSSSLASASTSASSAASLSASSPASTSASSASQSPSLRWIIQNVLFPSFRVSFTAPKHFATDGTVTQIACLENLYKIFERC